MSSNAELTLAVQLEQAGIPFEREFPFAKEWGRRWRADFAICRLMVEATSIDGAGTFRVLPTPTPSFLVEIDGGAYVAGRHTRGAGFEKDAEKASAAAILGYRVIRCTPSQVEDGRALSWIRQALGMEVAA